jgi:hypothetical protein
MSFSATPARSAATATVVPGTKDGRGCGDHDQPYTFGRRPRSAAPFPFTPRQYARLLALRGRLTDGLVGHDDVDQAGIALRTPSAVAVEDDGQPSLCYTCATCGAMVSGAFQGQPRVACAVCAQDGNRDVIARSVLLTAGVLD